mmetsp:Transcript_13800/g.24994  ORF Transcript_13800/g.24994 Transcript_13800/m.24994 type:complete len:214 (-) Transcript_13800:234-875(-)|eukprot:CAMPEP_0202482112 /NCGR_PEP_ID=MMETSP1361-20130828/1551_1 /ASSEMBLY_ACC=CAM_ASM_000849 /TAXON_ID=210615 /ORGANISM="Staurosira complex sp., Strain CCMP2646" /LENGTH=213 /DNA_ID=CAMNT_0049109853 /DNA_START=74 /DNA_END=715 /DNA_ORIENTATION=+
MGNKSKKKASSTKQSASSTGGQWLLVDPAQVRFQHSRIRPYFSGCGRSVQGTLDAIRKKELSPSELPPIQVIVGPEDNDGTWYFSLNNRRLWVLKRCREEGLLENNLIRVRVRQAKSGGEEHRYTLQNCSVEAKFIREKDPNHKEWKESAKEQESGTIVSSTSVDNPRFTNIDTEAVGGNKEDAEGKFNKDSATESDERSDIGAGTNPFSALI